jgi:HEAT repeat protein
VKHIKPWAALALGVHFYKTNDLSVENVDLRTAVVRELRLLLRDDAAGERKGAYSLALGLMGEIEMGQVIESEFKDTNVDVYKGYTALAMGLMDYKAAKETLLDSLETSRRRPEQLRNSAIALGILGDKEVLSKLEELLTDAKTTSVYAALADAIGFVGDARSIKPLVEISMDKTLTGEARAFAIVALGIIGDKDEFTWNSSFSANCNYRASVSTFTGQGKGILDIL